MLTPARGTSLDALVGATNSSTMQRANLSQSDTSFAQQLAESLEGYLNGASGGTHLEIDILPARPDTAGTRQFLITVTGPDSPSAAQTASSQSRGATSSAAVDVQAADTQESAAPTNEVDAYWATQPKEVQVLRTIDDPAERAEMGQKLANQGFIIDPNIMIHRWDPYMTMKIRQGEGYTWIPAVGQNGIPVSPGLDFPGLPSYEPNNPPPGSVRVTTDFAIGLEHTSPGAGNTNFSHAATS